jgi:hypothetical protein
MEDLYRGARESGPAMSRSTRRLLGYAVLAVLVVTPVVTVVLATR